MKRILFLLSAALMVVSCDDAYDLSKIDDQMGIGTAESEFTVPLARIIVGASELSGDAGDIDATFDEADVWLPSPLPENATRVDLVELKQAGEYLDTLLDALFEQMHTSDDKLDQVTDKIWENPSYRQSFDDLIGSSDEDEFKSLFKTLYRSGDQVSELIRQNTDQLARGYLVQLDVEPARLNVGKIDLGSDVVDMICNNLDPADSSGNALYLYGEVDSDMPVSIRTSPFFVGTQIRMDAFVIDPNEKSAIPQTRLYEADLKQILAGLTVQIPAELLYYYPDGSFGENEQIVFVLKLRKTGALKF